MLLSISDTWRARTFEAAKCSGLLDDFSDLRHRQGDCSVFSTSDWPISIESWISTMQITIISHGELTGPAEERIQNILASHGVKTVVTPLSPDQAPTHWWLLLVNGIRIAYAGTPESFQLWQVQKGSVLN
jgi:hypothetical protein